MKLECTIGGIMTFGHALSVFEEVICALPGDHSLTAYSKESGVQMHKRGHFSRGDYTVRGPSSFQCTVHSMAALPITSLVTYRGKSTAPIKEAGCIATKINKHYRCSFEAYSREEVLHLYMRAQDVCKDLRFLRLAKQ